MLVAGVKEEGSWQGGTVTIPGCPDCTQRVVLNKKKKDSRCALEAEGKMGRDSHGLVSDSCPEFLCDGGTPWEQPTPPLGNETISNKTADSRIYYHKIKTVLRLFFDRMYRFLPKIEKKSFGRGIRVVVDQVL